MTSATAPQIKAVERDCCSACGTRDSLETILDLGQSPIADNYTSHDERAAVYPLRVGLCEVCSLVQLRDMLPGSALFESGYSFYSSASAPLVAYHERYARDLRRRFRTEAERGVIEIGCNDGDMLQHFREYRHLGIDPAHGPVMVAAERGLCLHEAPFTSDLAASIDFQPGLIIANHVLAHVEDVSDFLRGVALLMVDSTVAVFEVQYFPDLIVNNAFDLFYHEHRNFFGLSTLGEALRQHGLCVNEATLTDRQGGSLRVVVSRDKGYSRDAQRLLQREEWLDEQGAYGGLQGRAEHIRARLQRILAQYEDAGRTVALYGAPAKATTLLSFCGFTNMDLAICWDTTPAKQGRYIPNTRIPIMRPGTGRDPDVFLLAAWNYAAAIMCANPGYEWVIPFPAPVILSSGCR